MTDADVKLVESAMGMAPSAWDMVDKNLLASVLQLVGVPADLPAPAARRRMRPR